jgi:hypothetical protein
MPRQYPERIKQLLGDAPHGPDMPKAERSVLIERLERAGLPEPEALFDAGVRHAWYASYMTDEELLAVKGIGPAALKKIRGIVPAREG